MKTSFYEWALQQGEYGAELINGWTGTEVDKNNTTLEVGISIDKVSKGSNKIMQFKCSQGHLWARQIYYITSRNFNCPFCYKQRGVKSLYQWCLENGAFGQELISEWTGIEVDENTNKVIRSNVDINSVSYGKHTYMAWKCKNGHIFNCRVSNRTMSKRRCPICQQGNQTSYPEQLIFHALKQVFPDTLNRQVVLKDAYPPRGIEFDIIIPSQRVCIEYSGAHWHEQSQERDNLKLNICKQRGLRFIQIVEDSHDILEHVCTSEYICFKMDYRDKVKILRRILKYILQNLGYTIDNIDLHKVDEDALYSSSKKYDEEKTIKNKYPNIFEEVHRTLNGKDIDRIPAGSNKSIYWECQKCHYGKNGEWRNEPINRISHKQGCPQCGYNWYTSEVNK